MGQLMDIVIDIAIQISLYIGLLMEFHINDQFHNEQSRNSAECELNHPVFFI